jgi:rubrerythrin
MYSIIKREIIQKEFKMSQTTEDLKNAFAGESQANRKYLAFAKKAEEEGHKQIAKLFRAVASAETIHAHAHLAAMGGVKTTKENLTEAAGGENYEVTTMYPPMIEEAKKEGEARAEKSFKRAWEVEKGHEVLYKEALENLEKPEESYDYYVCPVCGFTHARNAPDFCPICGTAGEKFSQIS